MKEGAFRGQKTPRSSAFYRIVLLAMPDGSLSVPSVLIDRILKYQVAGERFSTI